MTVSQQPQQAMEQASEQYPEVDVAIVMESTYPYLKGGVSAVVHDIVTMNPDISYGIIHISWDSSSPSEDLYGMPENVEWVRVIYLSMEEHRADFMSSRSTRTKMRKSDRREVARWFFDGMMELAETGSTEKLWDLYDIGFNPRTRTMDAWKILGTVEFMSEVRNRLSDLGLSFSDTFWLVRDFMSLVYALLGETMPKAKVYHAHTTGYASLVAAAAARDWNTHFLLTEHNLYVRDTVNTLLDRNMALPVRTEHYREFDVTSWERSWMAWWVEMGRFCYPSAEKITYLYPRALDEARGLDAPVDEPGRAVIVPNGTVLSEFNEQYAIRLEQTEAIGALAGQGREHVWKLVFIARVVPIKGLADLLDTLDLLIQEGITNFHLDVLGPTEHLPEYYELCRQKIRELKLEPFVTFHGTVNVRSMLGQFDILLMPSYNEGQPVVALEAMSAGIPVIGSDVGGMSQLLDETLETEDGRSWERCGLLTRPGDAAYFAECIKSVILDPQRYVALAKNARGRVEDFFQLEDVMKMYNEIYREVGQFPSVEQQIFAGSLEGEAAREALHLGSA